MHIDGTTYAIYSYGSHYFCSDHLYFMVECDRGQHRCCITPAFGEKTEMTKSGS